MRANVDVVLFFGFFFKMPFDLLFTVCGCIFDFLVRNEGI